MKPEKTIASLIPISLTIIAFASELLHIIHDPSNGILLICFIAIIWLFYYMYRHLTILKYSTRIFYDRDQATPLMKKDIRKYKHLAFIGISQTTLDTYLQEAINESKGNVLPWESITVFFADDAVGKMWENDSFQKNIRNSKIKITSVLFSEKNHKSLPKFDLVSFKQCRLPYSFGGCFCGNVQFDENNFSLEVIYSVNHLPIDTQTQKSWTIRVEQKAKSNEAHLFKEFEESFSQIRTNSEDLGEIKFSVWEWSFTEWNNFSTSYDGFNYGIDKMISTLEFNNKKILDIGAGTGNVAKHLIKLFPKAKFTLMDDAANMLHDAKLAIGNQAIYELFSFPMRMDYFIKKHQSEYDYIISHLSIPSIVSNKEDLNHLASHCINLLKMGGIMLIAVHNSQDIQLSQVEISNWNDTFKHDIESEIISKGFPKKNRNRQILREEDISDAFITHGFNEILRDSIQINITMSDRKRLWEVPAVLDSLVNLEEIGIIEGKKIVEKAFNKNSLLKTQDRFMTIFQFKKC